MFSGNKNYELAHKPTQTYVRIIIVYCVPIIGGGGRTWWRTPGPPHSRAETERPDEGYANPALPWHPNKEKY